MADDPAVPLAEPDTPNAGTPSVPSTINMPDHWVRQTVAFQLFTRLARPALDWVTVYWLLWVAILQPWRFNRFDITACGMAMAWCATVYGFKFTEKIKGVA